MTLSNTQQQPALLPPDPDAGLRFTSQITVELVDAAASDQHVADAARVSTAGERAAGSDRPISGLIRALMRERHGSPFEHNAFRFRVRMPLNVATEHLRHRIGWSYNGESGRYRVMEPEFYLPPRERPLVQVGKAMAYTLEPGDDSLYDRTIKSKKRAIAAAWEEYQLQLRAGVAREVARDVLPTSLLVSYYTTANARSLMAFLSLRTEDANATFPSRPLWEIQRVAEGYEAALAAHMPVTHRAFCDFGRVAP
jgi:thymidylate synthase (FAD)